MQALSWPSGGYLGADLFFVLSRVTVSYFVRISYSLCPWQAPILGAIGVGTASRQQTQFSEEASTEVTNEIR